MDLDLQSNGLRRTIVLVLPLVALVCVAAFAITTNAALGDPEPPDQYNNWNTAYVMIEAELGQRMEIRHEGGGDPDYLKLPMLNINDIVTVEVDQFCATTTVEYWASDPNHFPIFLYYFQGAPADPHFTFQFAAVVNGPYFVHTGQGLGTTYINMTITRQPVSPAPPAKDGNNAPAQKIRLNSGETHREDAGLPWDPSDFFYINIQPSQEVNKYLSIDIETAYNTEIQWELYDTTGITRPKVVYSDDTLRLGSGPLNEMPILVPGDYIVRVWMKEGFGQFNLTLTILSYPNDRDNSIDEATMVFDDDQMEGDVNYTFDWRDFYEIDLVEGEPLWVTLTPVNGPIDLYIFDASMDQQKSSRRSGLTPDRIENWDDHDTATYYIAVQGVYEMPDWEYPPTVNYTLDVWINYRPNVVSHLDPSVKNWHLDEDTIDSDYDVTVIFEDEDGDPLTYELDMSYNSTLVNIQLMEDNHLRIEPVKDASGFKIEILLNATDPRGLMVNYTAFIWIDPINDAPYVEGTPEEIPMFEDLVKSGVDVTKHFRDVDNDFSTLRFTATSTDHIHVGLDEDTWLATFTPLVDNWWGVETFVVTCIDKEPLEVTMTFTINMMALNDAPVITRYISPFEMDEEATIIFDMVGETEGPYFIDIEEEPLTFKFANNESITVEIVGNTIHLTGQKDFFGKVSGLVIWAVDDLGARSENMTLFVTVINEDDYPEVNLLIETVTVQEDEGVTFAIDVYYEIIDLDSSLASMVLNWYIDDELVAPENVSDKYAFEYIPPVTAEKDRAVIVTLEVIDGALDPVHVSWTVSVTNKNKAPDTPEITSEDDKKKFKEGETIRFSANTTDLDGDDLTYTWFLDLLEEVGTGTTLDLKNVKPGEHKVTVEVTDTAGAKTTADFNFDVEKKDDDNGTPGFGGGLAALAILGVIAAMVILRRR